MTTILAVVGALSGAAVATPFAVAGVHRIVDVYDGHHTPAADLTAPTVELPAITPAIPLPAPAAITPAGRELLPTRVDELGRWCPALHQPQPAHLYDTVLAGTDTIQMEAITA